MILVQEHNLTEKYLFFSEVLNGAGKNKFVSQFICLQTHFYVN